VNKKIIFLILGFLILVTNFDSVFGHGCQAHIVQRDFSMEGETFNRQSVLVGEPIKIQGSLVTVSQDQYHLKPWAVITISDESYFVDDIVGIFSGPNDGCSGGNFDGNLNWYFKITSEPSKTFTLEPNEAVQYFITLIPQKAGTYHIHSAMLKDDSYRIGPGQTVVVEGSDGITDGEIFGFYLPFFSSIVLITLGATIGVILLKRKFY